MHLWRVAFGNLRLSNWFHPKIFRPNYFYREFASMGTDAVLEHGKSALSMEAKGTVCHMCLKAN